MGSGAMVVVVPSAAASDPSSPPSTSLVPRRDRPPERTDESSPDRRRLISDGDAGSPPLSWSGAAGSAPPVSPVSSPADGSSGASNAEWSGSPGPGAAPPSSGPPNADPSSGPPNADPSSGPPNADPSSGPPAAGSEGGEPGGGDAPAPGSLGAAWSGGGPPGAPWSGGGLPGVAPGGGEPPGPGAAPPPGGGAGGEHDGSDADGSPVPLSSLPSGGLVPGSVGSAAAVENPLKSSPELPGSLPGSPGEAPGSPGPESGGEEGGEEGSDPSGGGADGSWPEGGQGSGFLAEPSLLPLQPDFFLSFFDEHFDDPSPDFFLSLFFLPSLAAAFVPEAAGAAAADTIVLVSAVGSEIGLPALAGAKPTNAVAPASAPAAASRPMWMRSIGTSLFHCGGGTTDLVCPRHRRRRGAPQGRFELLRPNGTSCPTGQKNAQECVKGPSCAPAFRTGVRLPAYGGKGTPVRRGDRNGEKRRGGHWARRSAV